MEGSSNLARTFDERFTSAASTPLPDFKVNLKVDAIQHNLNFNCFLLYKTSLWIMTTLKPNTASQMNGTLSPPDYQLLSDV